MNKNVLNRACFFATDGTDLHGFFCYELQE
jgi:hypothetical protein